MGLSPKLYTWTPSLYKTLTSGWGESETCAMTSAFKRSASASPWYINEWKNIKTFINKMEIEQKKPDDR